MRGIPLLLVAVLHGCGDGPSAPPEGVDLEALFAPPTPLEIAAVEAEWAARSPEAVDVREELASAVEAAGVSFRLRVLSHDIGGARHHVGVLEPEGAEPGSLPILVYAHGGDGGLDLSEVTLINGVLGDRADDFVWVAPSFRSEPLRVGSEVFVSGGEASPWDRDVDDALAAVDATLATTPAADAGRIGALGLSRGGGVALLMAVRDPRIDLVVEYFGPADFFALSVREIVDEALGGELRDLPGLDVLYERFLQPLSAGRISAAEVRRELIRRSPVLWVERLPDVQAHHGTADAVVDVDHAYSLAAALDAVGREPPGAEVFFYPGAGHDAFTLVGSIPRTLGFLDRLTGLTRVVAGRGIRVNGVAPGPVWTPLIPSTRTAVGRGFRRRR